CPPAPAPLGSLRKTRRRWGPPEPPGNRLMTPTGRPGGSAHPAARTPRGLWGFFHGPTGPAAPRVARGKDEPRDRPPPPTPHPPGHSGRTGQRGRRRPALLPWTVD